MLRDISWTHVMVGKFNTCIYDPWNKRWGVEIAWGLRVIVGWWP